MTSVGVIFGAAGGIGAACAVSAASLFDVVVLADLGAADAQPVARLVRTAGARPLIVEVDVCDESQVSAAVEVAASAGAVRGAVNCAAVSGPRQPIGDYSLEAWRRVIDVDLTGVFLCLREELRAMHDGSSIVNISSIFGHGAAPLAPAYTAAKHAVEGLSASAALAYADRTIRINTVVPGYIGTPLLHTRYSETVAQEIGKLHPLGRLGGASEVAAVTAFLLSEAASFVTGSCYRVDGGYLSTGP